jgi:hypothetical protein
MLPRSLSVSAWSLHPLHILNFFTVNMKLDTDIIPLQKLQISGILLPKSVTTILWNHDPVRQEGVSVGYFLHLEIIHDFYASSYWRRSFSHASPLETQIFYYRVCDNALVISIQTRPVPLHTGKYFSPTFHNMTPSPNIPPKWSFRLISRSIISYLLFSSTYMQHTHVPYI